VKSNALTDRPRLGRFVRRVKSAVIGRRSFSSSANYWEDRYRRGGNSGSGSYNRLRVFKAEVLNEFVADNAIQSVIEFGSGDGAQVALAKYPNYTGVDVSTTVVQAARLKYAGNPSIRFLHTSEVTDDDRAELALSLDVIYHLVEDEVFDTYMHRLFDAATKFVIIYSSNEEKGWPSPHIRHRQFTRWVEANQVNFKLARKIPNAYPYSEKDPDNTSFADFYIFRELTKNIDGAAQPGLVTAVSQTPVIDKPGPAVPRGTVSGDTVQFAGRSDPLFS
jgi:hypothetical protein